MKHQIPVLLALIAVVGCSSFQSTVTYHIGGHGTAEPCSFRIDPERVDRFLATRIAEVRPTGWTNDIHIATIYHRGSETWVIYDADAGYPSGIYARTAGKRFRVSGSWYCYLPELACRDRKAFEHMIETLQQEKAVSNHTSEGFRRPGDGSPEPSM